MVLTSVLLIQLYSMVQGVKDYDAKPNQLNFAFAIFTVVMFVFNVLVLLPLNFWSNAMFMDSIFYTIPGY